MHCFFIFKMLLVYEARFCRTWQCKWSMFHWSTHMLVDATTWIIFSNGQQSLQAFRAVTLVDGLPRACKFGGQFYKSEHIFWSCAWILLRIVQTKLKHTASNEIPSMSRKILWKKFWRYEGWPTWPNFSRKLLSCLYARAKWIEGLSALLDNFLMHPVSILEVVDAFQK